MPRASGLSFSLARNLAIASTIEAAPKGPKRPATATKKPYARSRVGNGKALLAGIDQRSLAYREYQDAVADLVTHMGGEPTAVELAIIEEAAGLIVWCRQARTALLKDDGEFNVGTYTTGVNSLRRLLADIGQERRLRDITPDLRTYAAMRAEKATAGSGGAE
jgi:hypothetical protein